MSAPMDDPLVVPDAELPPANQELRTWGRECGWPQLQIAREATLMGGELSWLRFTSRRDRPQDIAAARVAAGLEDPPAGG